MLIIHLEENDMIFFVFGVTKFMIIDYCTLPCDRHCTGVLFVCYRHSFHSSW